MMHCPVFLTIEKSFKLLSSAFFVKMIVHCGFRLSFKLVYTDTNECRVAGTRKMYLMASTYAFARPT